MNERMQDHLTSTSLLGRLPVVLPLDVPGTGILDFRLGDGLLRGGELVGGNRNRRGEKVKARLSHLVAGLRVRFGRHAVVCFWGLGVVLVG